MNRDRNPFYKRQAEPEMGNQLKRWRARTMRDTNNYEESGRLIVDNRIMQDRMNKERDLNQRMTWGSSNNDRTFGSYRPKPIGAELTGVAKQKLAEKTDYPQNWWKQDQVI